MWDQDTRGQLSALCVPLPAPPLGSPSHSLLAEPPVSASGDRPDVCRALSGPRPRAGARGPAGPPLPDCPPYQRSCTFGVLGQILTINSRMKKAKPSMADPAGQTQPMGPPVSHQLLSPPAGLPSPSPQVTPSLVLLSLSCWLVISCSVPRLDSLSINLFSLPNPVRSLSLGCHGVWSAPALLLA